MLVGSFCEDADTGTFIISLFTSVNYTTLVLGLDIILAVLLGAHDFVKSVMRILIFILSSLVLTTLHASIVYMTILLSLCLAFVIETYESIGLYCMFCNHKFLKELYAYLCSYILLLYILLLET